MTADPSRCRSFLDGRSPRRGAAPRDVEPIRRSGKRSRRARPGRVARGGGVRGRGAPVGDRPDQGVVLRTAFEIVPPQTTELSSQTNCQVALMPDGRPAGQFVEALNAPSPLENTKICVVNGSE